MRMCGACRAENADDASFCSRCGTPLDRGAGSAAERKIVSILFADIVGSTALGSRLDPERLREVLDAYVSTMREAIEAEGGTIEKFIGDAVMAVFGAPLAHEDDPIRAVRAALGIHRRLVDLNRDLESDHGVRIEVRVGVNTGEVFAVTDAPPDESIVTGDAVNVAARLEQSAPAGGVLIADRTARALRGIRLESVGPLELRGKEEPIEAFLAVGEEALGEPLERTGLPMIGRDAELELLRTTWTRVLEGKTPASVTVYGEAGVGKTRLVEELEGTIARDTPGARVVRGRCLPYGDAVVYWPLAEILKGFAGVTDSDPPETASSRVEEALLKLLWRAVPDPERACAALAFTVGLQRAGSFLEELAPARVQAETSAAWGAFFSAMASAGPVVVVIEDIHWADPALLALLETAVDGTQGPALFLFPSRPELAARPPEWSTGRRNASSCFLEPLAPREAERLLDGLISAEGIGAAPSLRETLVERTGGNPFFLEEVVRHIRERGSGGGVPDTVQSVLAARIDMLSPDDKRVLQCAAVVGKEFWGGAVEALIGSSLTDVQPRLAGLEDRGLVRRRRRSEPTVEPEYAFRHVLTRDVAYESLPKRDRAAAHAAVGTWIEERAGPRGREFAELLAHHFLAAFRGSGRAAAPDASSRESLRSSAFRYSLIASEDARTRLALGAAKARAEAALSIAVGPAERAGALGALGRARLHAAEGDLAWGSLHEAASILIADPGTPGSQVVAACLEALELVTRQTGAMRARLSPAQAWPLLEAALGRATADDDDGAMTRLRIVQAFWPYSFDRGRGTPEDEADARRLGEAASEMAARSGRPDLESAALDAVGIYYMERGLYGDWWPVVERRLELIDALVDPMELGDTLASAAWCAYGIGDFREAVAFADRGVLATIDVEPLMALYCLDWRAVARARLGDWDACLRDVEAAAGVMGERRTEPPGFACDHLAAAAFVHDERGDAELADTLLSIVDWVQRAEERPSPSSAVWAARVLGRRGRLDDARARLEKPELAGRHYASGQVFEAWCDIVADGSMWDLTEPIRDEARAISREGALRSLPCHVDRLEGMAAFGGGDLQTARSFLTAAADGFDAIGAAWEAARSRVRLAEVLAASGDRVRAGAALSAARPDLERSGSVRELERAGAIASRLESG